MRHSILVSAFAAAVLAAPEPILSPLEIEARRPACGVQPAGTGPAVHTPADDEASFKAYQPFDDAANDAVTPAGYTLAFQDLQASSQIGRYLGTVLIDNYDVDECATSCTNKQGCVAFNIYFERDPTVNPNSPNCLNPPSLTNIKCVRWGLPVSAETAKNTGQIRGDFHVAIAGSNGYNLDPDSTPDPGPDGPFDGPTELNGAINAPNDPVTKTNTYLGYRFYPYENDAVGKRSGDPVADYDDGVSNCLDACLATTAYRARHPPKAPKQPGICNQVVAYQLQDADGNQPTGVQCAFYTEEWDPIYATNTGQYRGGDRYTVTMAVSYVLDAYHQTYPDAICAKPACPANSYQGGNCGGHGPGTCVSKARRGFSS